MAFGDYDVGFARELEFDYFAFGSTMSSIRAFLHHARGFVCFAWNGECSMHLYNKIRPNGRALRYGKQPRADRTKPDRNAVGARRDMKYSKDTYRLYESESLIASCMRIAVTMKDDVDAKVLEQAANEAIRRYPYFAVKVGVDSRGAYTLSPNAERIAVLPVSSKPRSLGSPEVGGHLCFLEYEVRTIYFVMSHSLCGGKGVLPWLMTNVYQYVKDRYGVEPDAPAIRKPGEPFLDGEVTEPTMDMLSDEPPIYESKSKNPVMLYGDYLNGLLNPFVRDPNYYLFSFDQADIVGYAKENDASVVSFFMVAIARMLDRVLPKKHPVIGAETSHNPAEDIGLPYNHCDMHSMIYVDYERDMLSTDDPKLGTMTRGQILLQKDPSVSHHQLRKVFALYEQLDGIEGLKKKRAYIRKHAPSRSADARHSTFVCNYSGFVDWGEVANYIEDYAIVVDGHLVFEITSLGDRIFLAVMQLLRNDKYVSGLKSLFGEMGIPYQVKGPFPKHLSKHMLPRG